MRRADGGFALLEVLVAIIIVSAGLLGFAGTLRPVAFLAGDGKARGRAALQMNSRLSRLRSELLASAPDCVAPVAGSELSGSGITESWVVSPADRLVEVWIAVSIPRPRGPLADTLVTRIPCP